MTGSAASLRRVVWRFRAGRLPEDRVLSAFAGVLQRLAGRVSRLEGRTDLWRTIAGAPWTRQDEARAAALRALGWRDFEACRRLLCEAEDLLDGLEVAAEAEAILAETRRGWENFVAAHGLRIYAACPTLRIPLRLGCVARQLLEAGDGRQARLVARIQRAACDALRDRRRPPLEPSGPHAGGPGPPPAPRPDLDGLRAQGLHVLASRLRDDLDARPAEAAAAGGAVTVADLSARAAEIRRQIVTTCRPRED